MKTVCIDVILNWNKYEAKFTVKNVDGIPIDGAVITVSGYDSIATNVEGIALISPIPKGNYAYTIAREDYEPYSGSFVVE